VLDWLTATARSACSTVGTVFVPAIVRTLNMGVVMVRTYSRKFNGDTATDLVGR
jgi:hypothetical protein